MLKLTARTKAKEGPAKAPSPWEAEPIGQPDPVTLSEPSYDESGRLRWGSAKH